MKIVFFRTPRPKQFAYPPRYYDEEKERREQRRKELGLTDEKVEFSSRVRSNWNRFKTSEKSRKRKAEKSVLIYLLIVAALIYFIFF